MGRKARKREAERLAAKWGTRDRESSRPSGIKPKPLPQPKWMSDKDSHELNAIHLKAAFERLDRSVDRYRKSIRVMRGGQIESNRSKH